jgi:hypothetical protein
MQKRVQEFLDGASSSGEDHRVAMQQQLAEMMGQLRELRARPHATPGMHAAPAPEHLVGEALAREGAALGLRVKLEGIVEHMEGQSELQLCAAAAHALSTKIGGGAQVTVQFARWLQPPSGQGRPKRLMLGLGSEAMVRAVLSLKGKPGTPSRLAAGERVMSEYGAVEMAVRNVLFDEVRSYTGEGRAWVGRNRMFVNGQPKPLSERAVKAGMEALGRPPRTRPAPQRAQPRV